MSEAQVVAILGCDGTGLESTDGKLLVLLWDGTQRGAAAINMKPSADGNFVLSWEGTHAGGLAAVFQDGKLTQKTQSGLK